VPLGDPFGKVQKALTPQWATVVPFGMTSPFGHDVPGLPKLPNGDWSSEDIDTAVKDTAYLDDDVKLFFALGNALMDASIAAWAWKFKYDYVRPITGIHEEYRGRQVVSWLGPYKGYGLVDAERWIPYQERTVVTPPFPEYVSGHSTFSGAGARVLSMFTGSDTFGASVTVKAGASRFEPRTPTQPGTPATDVTLSWSTFSVAAGEAGMSRRYGGIHFESGDLHGRALGRDIGWDAWFKAQSYIKPISTGPL